MSQSGDISIGEKAAEFAAFPLLVINQSGQVLWSNIAAQIWFDTSLKDANLDVLANQSLLGNRLKQLIEQVFDDGRDKIALGENLGLSCLYDLHFQMESNGQSLILSATPQAESSGGTHQSALGFGRMLAHELKNPLASARGAAQLIQREKSLSQINDLADDVIEDIDRMTRLANHWSRVGDIQLGQTNPVNLNRIAMTALDNLKRAGGQASNQVECQFDPSLPETIGDTDLLYQAVLNVLQNACDAVSISGENIIIATRYDTGPRSRTGPISTPLVVSITDDGPGITRELGQGIFTPFVTTKPAGEGLGLAFSSRIAALHQGVLDYESEPGHTCFNLRLPVDQTRRTP